jgi:hypothetical protein
LFLTAIIEEDDELKEESNNSDSVSTCSGRSSCCTEASYELTPWRGTLSSSWQSLTSANATLMVPMTGEDASSLSDASGISMTSGSGVNTGTPPSHQPASETASTALILETVEDGMTCHYLIPQSLVKRGRLKRKGVKLHVCRDHLFITKHIKR